MHAIIRMYDYAKHDFPFLHFYPVIKWRRLWRALSIDLLRETENEREMMEEEEEQDELGYKSDREEREILLLLVIG